MLTQCFAGDRDVLSSSAGSLAGSVLLGGRQRQLAAFRRGTAHVKQVGLGMQWRSRQHMC